MLFKSWEGFKEDKRKELIENSLIGSLPRRARFQHLNMLRTLGTVPHKDKPISQRNNSLWKMSFKSISPFSLKDPLLCQSSTPHKKRRRWGSGLCKDNDENFQIWVCKLPIIIILFLTVAQNSCQEWVLRYVKFIKAVDLQKINNHSGYRGDIKNNWYFLGIYCHEFINSCSWIFNFKIQALLRLPIFSKNHSLHIFIYFILFYSL